MGECVRPVAETILVHEWLLREGVEIVNYHKKHGVKEFGGGKCLNIDSTVSNKMGNSHIFRKVCKWHGPNTRAHTHISHRPFESRNLHLI